MIFIPIVNNLFEISIANSKYRSAKYQSYKYNLTQLDFLKEVLIEILPDLSQKFMLLSLLKYQLNIS